VVELACKRLDQKRKWTRSILSVNL